jgi:hypothetical protein
MMAQEIIHLTRRIDGQIRIKKEANMFNSVNQKTAKMSEGE